MIRRYPFRRIERGWGDPFTKGEAISGVHAKACGTGPKIWPECRQCQMCCRCWCHRELPPALAALVQT